MTCEWVELKRYENDPKNLYYMLDAVGIDATISLHDGEYWLRCLDLKIDSVIDADIDIAKRVGTKMIRCALLQKAEEYKMVHQLMGELQL
jgi:hypothetical protein